MDKQRIWAKVCTTDPAHTKHVPQRGGFTAIDAYSQIQEATKVFGPCGEGWGWTSSLQFQDDCVIAKVSLWFRDSDSEPKSDPIEVYGCATWSKNGKTDTDAPKKAVTDGITKALSYLGFNADVFLGAFDGNKYTPPAQKPQGASQAASRPAAAPERAAPQRAVSPPPAASGDDWQMPPEIEAQASLDSAPGGWMAETISFGKHKGTSWIDMCSGGEDGGRQSWLEWLGHKVNPWLDRDGNAMQNEKFLNGNLLNCARARACLHYIKTTQPATVDDMDYEVPF